MNGPRRILIIDDDPDWVKAVQYLFEARGYAVQSAPDGRIGFDRARQLRPDLILLDVMMTERTEGFFTLQRIKADPELRETPVIVVSSIYTEFPGFKVDPKAGWLPADAFFAKPVAPEDLLEEAVRAIEAAGQRHIGRKVAS